MKSARRHRRRLSSEQLEQRIVLDGGGFIGLLLADIAPDSQLGDDPHVDTIGADASPLKFADGIHARVDSFIDSTDDIDVFQFAATGKTLRIAGQLVEGESDVHVVDEAGDNVVRADPTEPQDGFIQCDWGDFGFCDVFPTSPGETYFVTIAGRRVETTEYYFEFFQNPRTNDIEPSPPTGDSASPPVGDPDSRPGNDVHADEIGSNATALEFAPLASQEMNLQQTGSREIIATVDSYLDEADDVDAFRFMAQLSSVTISAYSWFDALDFTVELFDSGRNLIARSEVHSADPNGAGAFANLSLSLNTGEPYFLAVSGVGDVAGEYVLNVFQTNLRPATSRDADSVRGDDPHADHMGSDASILALDESGGTFVNSFIDATGDVDAFQFAGTGGFALAVAMNLGQRNQMSVRVFDGDRNEVESTTAVGGLANAPSFNIWPTAIGQTYYIEVAARDGVEGQYVLEVFVDPRQEDTNAAVDGFNSALAGLPDTPSSHDRVGTIGDANFDGRVDAMDFAIWNQHKFQYVQGPRNGDFNGDGAADAADFNIWNSHRFTRPAAADDDSTSERVPRAAAGTGLRMGASITVVGQVFNLSGQDEILSYGTTLNDAPVQRTSRRIDFVMAQVDAEQITSADAHNWVGNRRTRRDTSTVLSRSGASQPADDAVNDIDAKLVDKLFSSLGDG